MSVAAFFRQQFLPGMAGCLIGLLIAAGLLYRAGQEVQQRGSYQLASAWVASQQAVLQLALQDLAGRGHALSTQPKLQAAVASPAALASLSGRLQQAWPGLVEVRVYRPGELAVDGPGRGLVSYAVLDLLRRSSEASQPPAPEAIQINQRWLLFSSVPLRTVDGQLQAVLLQVIDLAQWLARLPALPDGLAELQLIQQFPGTAEQMLLQRGSGTGQTWRWPAAHPNWQLQLRAGPALQPVSFELTQWLLAVLAVLLGGLAGIFLSLVVQRRAASRDDALLPRARRQASSFAPQAEPATTAASPMKRQAGTDVFDMGDNPSSSGTA